MLRFEPLELVQQPIELLVGDLGIVVDVVALFVMPDGVAQLADALQHIHQNLPGPRRLEDSKTHEEKQTPMIFVVCMSFIPTPGNRAGRRAGAEQLAGDFRDRAIGREAEQHQADQAQRAGLGHVRANRPDHHARALVDRESADTGAERRERDRRDLLRLGQRQAVARRPLDERRRCPQVLSHDRRVNHVPGGEVPAGREDALARLDRSLRHRLGLDRLSAARLERAGHAGSHPERVVGGVDDGVGLLGGDVAVGNLEAQRRKAESDHENAKC